MSSSSPRCTDCECQLGWSLWTFWKTNAPRGNPCDSKDCDARLCATCYHRRPLMSVDDVTTTGDNDGAADTDVVAMRNDLSRATMKKYCQDCFERESNLDFTKSYTLVPPVTSTKTTTPSQQEGGGEQQPPILFVWVHGGGASRCLFLAHAEELYQRYGHHSLLIDLPGHGTLTTKSTKTELTLESCEEQLIKVMVETGYATKTSTRGGTLERVNPHQRIIYVGGSLGAYIGFHLLEKFCNSNGSSGSTTSTSTSLLFDGAVLMDCGQNVGPAASCQARLGLTVLQWMGNHCSNAFLMNAMADVTKKSPADYRLIDSCFHAGMFFDQASAQVECLRRVAPAALLPNIGIPILFMNGSKDYADSQHRWLECCQKKDQCELKVYDDGDHFFSHESRFVGDILTRLDAFGKKV